MQKEHKRRISKIELSQAYYVSRLRLDFNKIPYNQVHGITIQESILYFQITLLQYNMQPGQYASKSI